MNPDFGPTAGDYARYRAGFPDSFFDRLKNFGIGNAGQSVVDLGTGTGTLARGFARQGCRVTGVDIAHPQLVQARLLDRTEGLTIDYVVARAEETALPSRSFDVVAAGQCWHWFNRTLAAREAARLLRPDGMLVVAHFDWLPLAGNVVQATESLIKSHNPDWNLGGGMGMYPHWLSGLAENGFDELETFSYDVMVSYTHESWRGRVRASAGVGGSLPETKVRVFDEALARLLLADCPGETLGIPHRVFAILARA